MRSPKNQLSCYMTLFSNFTPYDLHALRPMVCGGFVVNTVAMTFEIPEKKKKQWLSLSSSYGESGRIADSIISVAIEVGPTL